MRSAHFHRVLPLVLAGLLLAGSPSIAQPLHRSAGNSGQPDLFVPPGKAPGPEARAALDALFLDYDVFELDTEELERRVRLDRRLKIYLGNQIFDLVLELNDLRAPEHQVVLMTESGPLAVDPGPVTTFQGRLADDPRSIVRLTVDEGLFTGYVLTEHDWVFIDPVNRYADTAPSADVVVYREGDIRPEAQGSCGSGHLRTMAGKLVSGLDLEPLAGAAASLRKLEVATDGDGEFTQRYGASGASSRIESILNAVDGIYRSQLNLFIQITFKLLWSSPSIDPYVSTVDLTMLENEFRVYWQNNFSWVNRDTAHLFTGKNIISSQNGSPNAAGIAYVAVVCNVPGFAYGLSEDQASSGLLTKLTAHEIGHNLSARHDNQTPVCSGVNCNGSGPIMCSFLQASGPNSFSNCSVNSVSNHVATHGSCLN